NKRSFRMSVRLLSEGIASGEMPDLPSNDTLPDVVPGEAKKSDSFNEAGFDKAFDQAWDQISPRDEAPKGPRRSLDDMLSEGLDRLYENQEDEKEWAKAKSARDEITNRYAKFGDVAPIENSLTALLNWAEKFKRARQGAGREFAASYLRNGSHFGLRDREQKPEKKAEEGHRFSKLDAIIDSAIDSATKDKKSFEASANSGRT